MSIIDQNQLNTNNEQKQEQLIKNDDEKQEQLTKNDDEKQELLMKNDHQNQNLIQENNTLVEKTQKEENLDQDDEKNILIQKSFLICNFFMIFFLMISLEPIFDFKDDQLIPLKPQLEGLKYIDKTFRDGIIIEIQTSKYIESCPMFFKKETLWEWPGLNKGQKGHKATTLEKIQVFDGSIPYDNVCVNKCNTTRITNAEGIVDQGLISELKPQKFKKWKDEYYCVKRTKNFRFSQSCNNKTEISCGNNLCFAKEHFKQCPKTSDQLENFDAELLKNNTKTKDSKYLTGFTISISDNPPCYSINSQGLRKDQEKVYPLLKNSSEGGCKTYSYNQNNTIKYSQYDEISFVQENVKDLHGYYLPLTKRYKSDDIYLYGLNQIQFSKNITSKECFQSKNFDSMRQIVDSPLIWQQLIEEIHMYNHIMFGGIITIIILFFIVFIPNEEQTVKITFKTQLVFIFVFILCLLIQNELLSISSEVQKHVINEDLFENIRKFQKNNCFEDQTVMKILDFFSQEKPINYDELIKANDFLRLKAIVVIGWKELKYREYFDNIL